MTTLREAAQQALAYMDSVGKQDMYPEEWAVAEALRAALEQPEQEPDWDEIRCGGPGCDLKCCQPVNEPVAKIVSCYVPSGKRVALKTEHQYLPIGTDLYTHPPRRDTLTEDEILSLFRNSGSPVLFARAIEAKHGIV